MINVNISIKVSQQEANIRIEESVTTLSIFKIKLYSYSKSIAFFDDEKEENTTERTIGFNSCGVNIIGV